MINFNKILNKKVSRAEIVEAMLKDVSKPNVVLDWPPRFGKSSGAIALIKKWDSKKILIVGDRLLTVSQWNENIKQYSPEILNRIKTTTYQSLHKEKDEYDCIVLDEADLGFTNKRMHLLSNLNPKNFIILSGTMDKTTYERLSEINIYDYDKFKVSFEQGVNMGILPEPLICVLTVKPSDIKGIFNIETGKKSTKVKPVVKYEERFKYKGGINMQVTAEQGIAYLDEEVSKYQLWMKWYSDPNCPDWFKDYRSTVPFSVVKNKMLQTAGKRKKFISELKNRAYFKLHDFLSDKKPDYRSVVFCVDTEQADFINEEFSVHSKKTDSQAQVEAFNNGEINHLICCKILDRGKDLTNFNYTIFLQLDGKTNSSHQRVGRHFLSESPIIYIFRLDHDSDKKYVNNFLSIFQEKWIKFFEYSTLFK